MDNALKTTSKDQEKNRRGRFKPGQSGNPAGRPVGRRNKVTLACMCILEKQAEALTGKLVSLAMEGNLAALKMCLERLCPVPKWSESFTLPDTNMTAQLQELSRLVAHGELDAGKAAEVAATLDKLRRKAKSASIFGD